MIWQRLVHSGSDWSSQASGFTHHRAMETLRRLDSISISNPISIKKSAPDRNPHFPCPKKNRATEFIPIVINMFGLVQINNRRRYFCMIPHGYSHLWQPLCYLSRRWIKDLHPCGSGGPIIYKRAAIMFSIKKILERWDQSLYLIENPKQADKTTAIGKLFWQTL